MTFDQDADMRRYRTGPGHGPSSGGKGIGVIAGHLRARAATLVITVVAGDAVFDRLKAPSTGRAVAARSRRAHRRGHVRPAQGRDRRRKPAAVRREIAAEAREKIGKEARPPAADAGHHDHDH